MSGRPGRIVEPIRVAGPAHPIRAFARGLLAAGPQSGTWAQAASTVSWVRMRSEVDGLHGLLAVAGIGPGATVSVRMQPSFTLIWTVLALWTRGASVSLLDPADRCGRPAGTHHIRSGGFGPGLASFTDECEVVVGRRTPAAAEAAGGSACLTLRGDEQAAGRPGALRSIGPASLRSELAHLTRDPSRPRRGERSLLLGSPARDPWWVTGVLLPLVAGATLVLPGRDGRPAGGSVDVAVGPPSALLAAGGPAGARTLAAFRAPPGPAGLVA